MVRVLSISLAILLFAAPAIAVPITYELQQGSENGFGFSGLHDADDDSPMSGPSIGDLHGTLTLDWQEGTSDYVFVSSTVWLDSDEYKFQITGGELSGSGGGFLSFELAGAGPFAQSGNIIFTGGPPVCCGPNGPNRIDPSELRLWGAAEIKPGTLFGPKRFGMDLGANAAVPEPSAALVFGLGAVVIGGAFRRRQR